MKNDFFFRFVSFHCRFSSLRIVFPFGVGTKVCSMSEKYYKMWGENQWKWGCWLVSLESVSNYTKACYVAATPPGPLGSVQFHVFYVCHDRSIRMEIIGFLPLENFTNPGRQQVRAEDEYGRNFSLRKCPQFIFKYRCPGLQIFWVSN